MADYERQERFINFLRTEPLRSSLLQYCEERGITGDTYGKFDSEEDKERFKLMEAFDRIAARKIFRAIKEKYRDCDQESKLDGKFTSGGTWHNLEIKSRCYTLNWFNTANWPWVVDPEKYQEMLKDDGWLLYLWPHDDDPLTIDWAIWNVAEVEPEDVMLWCRKSVAKQDAGDKRKKFPG